MPIAENNENTRHIGMPLAAQRGREYYTVIRDALYNRRRRGVVVKRVWVSQYTADTLHALWTYLAQSYDQVLPKRIEGVPFSVGMTGGDDYVLEIVERPTDAQVLHTTTKLRQEQTH